MVEAQGVAKESLELTLEVTVWSQKVDIHREIARSRKKIFHGKMAEVFLNLVEL